MQTVILDACNNVTQDIIKPLAKSCPNLRKLDLGSCLKLVGTNSADQPQTLELKPLFHYCTQLQYLSVAYCQGVTADAFEFMANDKTVRTATDSRSTA